MRITAVTDPGNPAKSNEDNLQAGAHFAAVIDGATARLQTGCYEGVAWYSAMLGSRLAFHSYTAPTLADALAAAIRDVSGLHDPRCDLNHPGTPSAVLAAIRHQPGSDDLEWLLLGDCTLSIDATDGLHVERMPHEHVAAAERAEANQYPIGDPRKDEVLKRMKKGEHAARNVEGGFWVAAADPSVVNHAHTGSIPIETVGRALLLTDGAARLVDVFDKASHTDLVDIARSEGPQAIIRRVRSIEEADPTGTRHPRNKKSDDATALLATFQ